MAGDLTLEGRRGKNAVKMLTRICSCLDRAGIPYLLEAGTLLGVVRENRLLPWDNDLDITVTREHERNLMKYLWRLRLCGYLVRVKYYRKDMACFKEGEVRIIKVKHVNLFARIKKDIVLDIFLKRRIGEEYQWTVGLNPPVLKAVPHRFYSELSRREFAGYSFSVPADSEGYLEEHYGKDWRVPVKEWDFRTSDNSVREILD